MKFKPIIIIVLFFLSALFASAQSAGGRKMADIKADVINITKINDSTVQILVGNVILHHNGAILTCDSAVRYSEKRMEFFNNVVINKKDVYAYGNTATYNGTSNRAQIFAPIIKMVDKDATLYTYEFTFNTLENIGHYSNGGTMSQKDNLLESREGYYYSNTREILCIDQVELKNPDYRVKSDSLKYNLDTEIAEFFVKTHIWNSKGEILSAKRGTYNSKISEYDFTLDSYILTEKQELWADSINYNSQTKDAVLKKNIQIKDEDQKLLAFGDLGKYWGIKEEALLTETPSIISFDSEDQDSLYMRSDSMFMYTVNKFDEEKKKESEVGNKEVTEEQIIDNPISKTGKNAVEGSNPSETTDQQLALNNVEHSDSLKIADIPQKLPDDIKPGDVGEVIPDSVVVNSTLRDLTKSEVAKEKTVKNSKAKDSKSILRSKSTNKDGRRSEKKSDNKRSKEAIVLSDSTKEQKSGAIIEPIEDALNLAGNILKVDPMPMDSLAKRVQEIASMNKGVAKDENGITSDSTQVSTDTALIAPTPTREDSLVKIIRAYNNVKFFRKDFQGVCDSLVAFSIDSTIHMYHKPILWNEKNQITSDEVEIFTKNQQIEKAIFKGSPIMGEEIDSTRYNQVKGKIMTTLFKNGNVYKNEVDGNGQTYYYMRDNELEEPHSFLVAECAKIVFLFENKELHFIKYIGSPVYDLHPILLIPEDQEQVLPGFVWEIKKQPKPEDIFTRKIRPSEREEYVALPQPLFPKTESIMKHKEGMIKSGAWRERNDRISQQVMDFIIEQGYRE